MADMPAPPNSQYSPTQMGQDGGPGGGASTPAPPQPNQGATEMTTAVMEIVRNARVIADRVPSAAPIVRKINILVQELQRAIVSNQPPQQTAAPPV